MKLAIEVSFEELTPRVQIWESGYRRGDNYWVGRGAVLNEAVQKVVLQWILAAVREYDVKTPS